MRLLTSITRLCIINNFCKEVVLQVSIELNLKKIKFQA